MTSLTYSLCNFFGLGTKCQLDFNAIHPKNKDAKPLNSCKVKVFAQNFFSYIPFASYIPWLTRREIGTFTTDAVIGSFSHNYNVIQLPFQSHHNLQFEFYEESRATRSTLSNYSTDILVKTHHASIPTGKVSIKDVEVELYELEDYFPQYEIPKNAANLSNQWNAADYARIIQSSMPGKIADFAIGMFSILYPTITDDQIEKIQGIENKLISEESTLDIILNGIEPSFIEFSKGEYLCEINWDGCELKQNDDLANAKLYAKKNGDGKLKITKICFQNRGKKETTHRSHEENYDVALYEFNRLALVHGSLAHHLGCHKEGEQYATAFFRHINKNPLRNFIDPFMRGVLPINQKAQANVVTALTESGITFKGAWTKLEQILSKKCWSDQALSEVLCEDHHLAKASHEFWKDLDLHFEAFFNDNKKEILNFWHEIEDYSDFLVERSLPLSENHDPEEREGRVIIDGKYKTIRPIVSYVQDRANHRKLHGTQPNIQDIQNLKLSMKYISYLLSWKHWTLHVSEEIGLDADFAAFAPTSLTGKARQESRRRQEVIGLTLTRFKDGTIAKNPNKDIYQPLVDHFNKTETINKYAKMGYDPREIFYGTII